MQVIVYFCKPLESKYNLLRKIYKLFLAPEGSAGLFNSFINSTFRINLVHLSELSTVTNRA